MIERPRWRLIFIKYSFTSRNKKLYKIIVIFFRVHFFFWVRRGYKLSDLLQQTELKDRSFVSWLPRTKSPHQMINPNNLICGSGWMRMVLRLALSVLTKPFAKIYLCLQPKTGALEARVGIWIQFRNIQRCLQILRIAVPAQGNQKIPLEASFSSKKVYLPAALPISALICQDWIFRWGQFDIKSIFVTRPGTQRKASLSFTRQFMEFW